MYEYLYISDKSAIGSDKIVWLKKSQISDPSNICQQSKYWSNNEEQRFTACKTGTNKANKIGLMN